MPPKAKFEKNELVSAALEIAERDGIEMLTARELGKALGSSARPIFTVFAGMDEVKLEVIAAAQALYAEYVEKGLECEPAFKGVGTMYIKFAAEHPRLFRLLFMNDERHVTDISSALGEIDGSAEKILKSITDGYGFAEDVARKLYLHMWIYTHGIASLTATGVCAFTKGEISEMLTDVCAPLIKKYKTGV